jgi:hypothetical protein
MKLDINKGVSDMNSGDKNYLIKRLTETHSSIQRILKGVDLELQVYSDTDWRIRDILGHIATWDREVTKSLRAFLTGSEYIIPDLDEEETEFNQQAVTRQRELSTQEIVEEWDQAREDFKAALSDIPTDHFPGDLIYPWGDERGSIARLVEYMIEHDEEHQDEIVKVVQAQ